MSLTTNDLKLIKDVMKITIEEDETLVRKIDVSYLPTKEEFYTQTDKIMGELKSVREEMVMLSDLNRKVNDHEEKIENIEKILNIQPAI
jgi:hypothetical protein